MSRSGHPPGLLAPPLGAALVGRFALARGHRFAEHVHPTHQLAWAERGVLSISAGDTTWALPPTRALWIPAGVRHTTAAATATAMHSLYLRPARVPGGFEHPTVLAVTPLLAALIGHLGRAELGDAERARAEAVLFDQLVPAPVASVELALPADDRARRVADALLADPADDRGVDALARLAGASPRTLHRLFRDATGCGLAEWRTRGGSARPWNCSPRASRWASWPTGWATARRARSSPPSERCWARRRRRSSALSSGWR